MCAHRARWIFLLARVQFRLPIFSHGIQASSVQVRFTPRSLYPHLHHEVIEWRPDWWLDWRTGIEHAASALHSADHRRSEGDDPTMRLASAPPRPARSVVHRDRWREQEWLC